MKNLENTTPHPGDNKVYHATLRSKIISDLHTVFCDEFESGDMKLTQAAMNAIIKFHGLRFLEPREIDTCFFLLDVSDIETSFFDAINSQRCLDLPYFAIQCEAYIDFTHAIRKDNETRYGAYAMYHHITVNDKSIDINGAERLRA